MSQEIENVIQKLKKEHGLKGETAATLLSSVRQSLELIHSAKNKMQEDSEVEHLGASGPYKVPYGFTQNRFGELKPHPGTIIVKDAENNLRACLKQLGLDTEKGEPEKKPTGLAQMIANKGGKVKRA